MNIVCVDDGQRWIHYARLGLGFSYGLTSYYSDVNDIPMGINDKLNAVIDRLAAVGGGEDKFLRQIPVCYIIQAPLYWWSEMDTYKIGTTAQSESTMHSLGGVPVFTQSMFERTVPSDMLDELNVVLSRYKVSHSSKDFLALKTMLPSGWLQRRMWTANYAVIKNIYRQRKNHRLPEWHQFCDFIRTNTPMVIQSIFKED